MDQPCESVATSADWSNLPSDILIHLLKYMDITLDVGRIRGVCSTWRTSIPVPKPRPGIPVPNLYKENQFNHLLLVESRFYLISPIDDTSTPWLVRIVNTGVNKWRLLDPFNLQDYFHSSHPSITTQINLFDSHLIHLATPWSLLDVFTNETISKKVVGRGGWNLDDFAVLALLEQGGGLVFTRFGQHHWVRIEGTFLDIAYHNGLFYTFDLANWKVGLIDPTHTEISLEFMDAPKCRGETIDDNNYSVSIDGANYIVYGVYFVPCISQLYLIIRSRMEGTSQKKETLFVFELKKQGDEIEDNKWERVRSLREQILYIGYDVSFGMSSTFLPNWKPGSICIFLKPSQMKFDACTSTGEGLGLPEGAECLEMIAYPQYWRYINMYNMEQEEIGLVGFQRLSGDAYLGLFFPPPVWVKWNCPSRNTNVDIRLHNLKFTYSKKRWFCNWFTSDEDRAAYLRWSGPR